MSKTKHNSKFTIVANPFTLPFEEIMLHVSEIPNDDFGFIGGIDSTGRVCVAEEEKLFRGKPLTFVSSSYDTEDFDLSLSPNGWLVFEESRTTIREYLFQIYKVLRAGEYQHKFYRPKFENYSSSLRIGYVQGEDLTIKKQYIDYLHAPNSRGIGSVFSGGGRTQEFLTVLPIPSHISTFQLMSIVLQLTNRECIKYIITSNNYSYRFNNRHVERCAAPIIEFLKTEYDCLLIEGSPDEDLPLISGQLAAHLEVPSLRNVSHCDYKNVRSEMSDKSHSSVWLFIFDFMHYMEDTDILSGSHLYKVHGQKEEKFINTYKKVRIGL